MMEHKAFVFDYAGFDRELRSILEGALASGDCAGLVSFINANLHDLRDPYQGEPLIANWEGMVETQDAHQYGDFALTKYYDPKADFGLGVDWDSIQQVIARDSSIAESPILGTAIGPVNDPFDPGKMGAYFQSKAQVQTHLQYLMNLCAHAPIVNDGVRMLKIAANANSGLYVTF